MLSRFDDYPIHQTPEPIGKPASSDRNVYDRYWFNGYAEDGEHYFGVGMAIYPNRGILDCGFSIVRDGVQHAFHGSRRAPADPAETRVGPFRIEVVEPMRSVRVVIERNDTGIECDLVFHARTACVEEGRQTMVRDRRVVMDATRFAQFGRWSGEIRYDGVRLPIDPARVLGTKDRSWGVRPVGEPETGGAPPTRLPQVFFLWAPIQWGDQCTHYGVFDDETGHSWHQDGMLVPVYERSDEIPGVVDPGVQRMRRLEHRIQYAPGTRRAAAAEIALVGEGGRIDMQLEPLLCFRMKGIGYSHREWGHGFWKGDLAIGGESWRCDDLDPMALENQHIQQVVSATRSDRPGATGVGVLEQIAFGPHARYGFKELLDPAS